MTLNVSLRSFLILGMFAGLLTLADGCGNSTYTPPLPCSSALACAGQPDAIYQSSLCPYYAAMGAQQNNMFEIRDLSKDKALYATFLMQVRHLNDGTITTKYSSLLLPVSTTPTNLGCQFEPDNPPSDLVDQYYFTTVSACFVGDPNCTNPNDVAQRPPNVDCFASNTNCITFDLSTLPAGPEKQAAAIEGATIFQLAQKAPPLTINIGKLFPASQCNNRADASISNGVFEDDGLACSQGFTVPNATAKAVVVTVPAILRGSFTQIVPTIAAISFTDTTASPVLEWFDHSDKSLGVEYIREIDVLKSTGGKPELKILGARRFCFVIVFPPQ